jgi:hypothetical protein
VPNGERKRRPVLARIKKNQRCGPSSRRRHVVRPPAFSRRLRSELPLRSRTRQRPRESQTKKLFESDRLPPHRRLNHERAPIAVTRDCAAGCRSGCTGGGQT